MNSKVSAPPGPVLKIANDFSLEMGGANMVLVLVAVSSFQ